MINCVLKMLGVSLVQGLGTFATLCIVAIPFAVVLLYFLFRGIQGVNGYASTGRAHAIGGWILIGSAIAVYVAVALWSDDNRTAFKQFAIRNVQDKTAGLDNRRMAMMVDSGKNRDNIVRNLAPEDSTALLRVIQAYLNEEGGEEEEAFNYVLGDYIKSMPSIQTAVRDAVNTGKTMLEAILKNVSGEDVQRLLEETCQSGDLGSAVKASFRQWFSSLDREEKQPIEISMFRAGTPNECDAREIAYRSGYGTSALGAIRFFVAAQRWFRGLIWCLVAIAFGILFVAGGRKITERAEDFKLSYDDTLRSVFGGLD